MRSRNPKDAATGDAETLAPVEASPAVVEVAKAAQAPAVEAPKAAAPKAEPKAQAPAPAAAPTTAKVRLTHGKLVTDAGTLSPGAVVALPLAEAKKLVLLGVATLAE